MSDRIANIGADMVPTYHATESVEEAKAVVEQCKTSTERLRAMLDEHGVEWAEYGGGYTEFWVRTAVDGERYYIDVKHYTVQPNVMCSLVVAGLTPEQVIAATLEAGTCKQEEHGWSTEGDHARVWLTCGHDCMVETVADLPNFCPICGRKVVDE